MVNFVGAGPGAADLITVRGKELLENADIIISSSFHATAFSHIFHKKFGVILPNNNGERLESFLWVEF